MEQERLSICNLDQMQPSQERLLKSKQIRAEKTSNALSFGISFFDDVFSGIYPQDLVLIGASSGFGKTELATQIALSNVANGKRVHFFALEAEENEIEDRITYKYLANKYYSILKEKIPNVRMDYTNWYEGKLDAAFADYMAEINEEVADKLKTLTTFYRTSGEFTVETFEKQILAIQDSTDLIILDHLHYFDWDETDDNRAVKRIVKTIRNVVQLVKKPVVLVAHLRKRDNKSKQLVPGLEEFHGTSDIGKIATKAITISPAYDVQGSNTRYPTYLRAAKNRLNSYRGRFIALTAFDVTRNEYEKEYLIGHEKTEGKFEPISFLTEIPWWAKGAKTPETESIKRHRKMVGNEN